MKLSVIAKKTMSAILLCNMAIALVFFIFALINKSDVLPYIYGVLAGTGISLLKVAMIERAVKRVAEMAIVSVGPYVGMQHLIRFGITGMLMVAVANLQDIDILSTAASVLSFQVAVKLQRHLLINEQTV